MGQKYGGACWGVLYSRNKTRLLDDVPAMFPHSYLCLQVPAFSAIPLHQDVRKITLLHSDKPVL